MVDKRETEPKRAKQIFGQKPGRPFGKRCHSGRSLHPVCSILLWNGAPPLQPRERALLMNYEEVRVSLVRGDLATAERIAAQITREFGDWVPVSSPVRFIANSDSLESARKAFAKLSQEAIRLAERHLEYVILRCPTDCPEKCANCRSNEFGSWVQIDTLVGNPFMGTASPHCGARIQ
jgi:hypothetical protein